MGGVNSHSPPIDLASSIWIFCLHSEMLFINLWDIWHVLTNVNVCLTCELNVMKLCVVFSGDV